MKVRAKDKDGNVVVGWYCLIGMRHFLLKHVPPQTKNSHWVRECREAVQIIEIDIATAAVETDKLDLHGNVIYGSKGKMKGGDRIQGCTSKNIRMVHWDPYAITWTVTTEGQNIGVPLREYDTTGHEIIPPEDK